MPRPKLALAVCLIAAAYWVAIFVATHLPHKGQEPPAPPGRDKTAHCLAYLGLAVLLCAAGAARGTTGQRLYASVLGTVAVYGILDEMTQALVPTREGDLYDWLADLVGAGIGVMLISLGVEIVAALQKRRSRQLAASDT